MNICICWMIRWWGESSSYWYWYLQKKRMIDTDKDVEEWPFSTIRGAWLSPMNFPFLMIPAKLRQFRWDRFHPSLIKIPLPPRLAKVKGLARNAYMDTTTTTTTSKSICCQWRFGRNSWLGHCYGTCTVMWTSTPCIERRSKRVSCLWTEVLYHRRRVEEQEKWRDKAFLFFFFFLFTSTLAAFRYVPAVPGIVCALDVMSLQYIILHIKGTSYLGTGTSMSRSILSFFRR